MKELILKRIKNKCFKKELLQSLAEKRVTSEYPEYYDEAYKIVEKMEPARLRAAILSCRYSVEDVAYFLGISTGTVYQYRKQVINTIRESVSEDEITWPDWATVPYYLGILDPNAIELAGGDL